MRSSVLVVALVAACDRPDFLVVCHNGNCAEPQDPDADDTVRALTASLALGDIIDGIELDMLVHDGRCLLAHDTGEADTAITLLEGAQLVADHVRTLDDGTHFIVHFDIKPTPALDTAVDCALAAFEELRAVSDTHPLTLDVQFGAYAPKTLRAVAARLPASTTWVRPRIVLGVGVPQPLLDDNHPFSELGELDVDIVSVHPGWITDTALRAVRSMNVELAAWCLDVTRETLDGIGRVRPTYVTTGQARTLRSWLEAD